MGKLRTPLAFGGALALLCLAFLIARAEVQARLDAGASRREALVVALAAPPGPNAPESVRARDLIPEFLAQYETLWRLSNNIARIVLPLSLGTGVGVWLAMLALVASAGLRRDWAASQSPARIWKLSAVHVAGLTLWMIGSFAIAVIAARVVGVWYWPGVLPIGPPRTLASVPSIAETCLGGVPLAVATLSLGLGAILIRMGAPSRPFVRLSRVRALALSVAAAGAACALYSHNSASILGTRTAAVAALASGPMDSMGFEVTLGRGTLLRAALPAGVTLLVVGLVASFAIPSWLRRNTKFLAGATECVECAHPLVWAQTRCPECGADHVPDTAGQ